MISIFAIINQQVAKKQQQIRTSKFASQRSGSTLNISPLDLKPTDVYDTYWKFAFLRQETFLNRLSGGTPPWTNDPIISKFRFTNVYRAADRVSQFLIKEVIYNKSLPSSAEEILFRILIFKLFNKIETWELLTEQVGPITFSEYDFKRYNDVLASSISSGMTIYSAAYIIPPVNIFGFAKKHSNHLKLIEHMLMAKVQDQLMSSVSMQGCFEIIKKFPGLGDFLAYQLLIDINYSPIIDFPESDFVVAGPGAKGGISKCFSNSQNQSYSDIIKFVTSSQEAEFTRLGLPFRTLWGRPLQLIDCQNLFCEVDKYARVKHPDIKGDSDRKRIKQTYKTNEKPLDIWFPPKWGLNDKIDFDITRQKISSQGKLFERV